MSELDKRNPIHYSIPLMLFLTVCLLFAEHQSAVQMHGNIDLDYLVSKQGGRLQRQLAYIAMGIVGLAGTWHVLRVRRPKLRWDLPLTIFLSLLLFWSFLSVVWTDTPETTARRLFVLFLLFLGAFGVALSWTKKQILDFMVYSSAIQITVGVVAELMFGYFTPWSSDYRFAGTLPWNSQGYVCLVLALSGLCRSRLEAKGLGWFPFLAAYGFVFLLLTRSRGGLVAFTIALVLYLMLTLNARQKLATFLAVGTIALMIITSGSGPAWLDFLNRGGEGSENFTGRAPLWDELMTYVHKRPLTGYGYEGFWTIDTIDDISGDQFWAIDNAHSSYVEGLLELGWIGMILHTVALLVGGVEGIKVFRRTNDYTSFLGASFCFVYLAGGVLEALFIVKPSQSSFYFAILLCVMAVQPQELIAQSSAAIEQTAIVGYKEGYIA